MNMSLKMPQTVADYIDANLRLDLEGMMKEFTPDAVFTDNGKAFVGKDAIRAMLREEAIAVKAIFEPDTSREEDGKTVLEGAASGEFPGSPLRFTYRFALQGDAIKSLETTIWA